MYKLQTELSNLMVGLIDLRNVVDQRLRWAVGANSQLQDVVDQFSAQHTNQIENAKHAGHTLIFGSLHFWIFFGSSLGHFWIIFGSSLDHIWIIFGSSLDLWFF